MAASDWLYRWLLAVEKAAAYGQGKGFGKGTVVREVERVASCLHRAPTLAVDIGAHSGTYTRALQNRFGPLEIHLFEPAAFNIDRLRRRHGADPGVVINACAVSDRNGSAALHSDKPGSGYASLHKRNLDHYGMPFDVTEQVTTIRFGDYWNDTLGRREIDILKMDIEGHELAALGAFGDALAATRVLQFEFGGTNVDSRTFFQDFFYLFTQAGFDLRRITPMGLERIDRYRESDENFSTVNYLAVNRRSA